LACYGGQPSNYTCFSTQESSFTCQRTFLNCSRNGCQDNICRSLGVWSNNVAVSDFGTIFRPFCADTDSCTSDFCNTNWVDTMPAKDRCLHVKINATLVCDDGNYCTQDYCDSKDTTGDPCRHNLYSQSYLKRNICPPTNESTTCTTVQCTVNRCIYNPITCLPGDFCTYFLCNSTTKNTCIAVPTGLYFVDKCGVCGGDGLSCVPDIKPDPKKTSIIVALAVGLSVGLVAAAILIAILTQKSYAAYQALAMEIQGTVTTSPVFENAESHFNAEGYENK